MANISCGDSRTSDAARRVPRKTPDFSTLPLRVLKVYGFVTHFTLKWFIIQTVSKIMLISKNVNQARQVPTLPYELHKSAYNIIKHRRYYYVWTYKT